MQSKEVKKWKDQEALKRYQMIAPLMDPDLDEGKRLQMREDIARNNGLSVRTLYRYEEKYRNAEFEGLRPRNRGKRRSQKLIENFDEIVGEAIQLKREVPKRSVRQIIKILELEGWAPSGVLKQSTMQRYLYNAGFGIKQMKKYAEGRTTSSRRFCRPHRMELLQGDIKYGPDIRTSNGKLIKTYLSSLIDDHSRYSLQSEFYDNQRQEIVEDTFHKAILKFGKFDCGYVDNGTQYISRQLNESCARLGIRLLRAKPRACEAKGKIFLEQEYQTESHDGIREYYESYGIKVVPGGITPKQEFDRDTRNLVFIDTGVVSEAFLHKEERKLDNAGCFSFENSKYEASTALANAQVIIAYDPMNTETVKVQYRDMEPITAHRIKIGSFSDKKPLVPVSMSNHVPETSRFLDTLEKKYNEDHQIVANAISFGDYGKAGER
ncbi:MAG: DDE-type integrase/transposase/recombinase [Clostridiales bacterium]|nr:DDE-type integrase/transposase/recombinase [Clostridiales bacterium]